MTDTNSALLRAILERPEDDLPRLVYADWLEERVEAVSCERCGGSGKVRDDWFVGDETRDVCSVCHGTGTVSNGKREYAEFIRVQIELAELEQVSLRVRSPGEPIAISPATANHFDRHGDLCQRERELWGSWPDRNDIRSYFHAAMPAASGGWCVLPESEAVVGSGGLQFVIVRRGLISKVQCTLRRFLGGECGPCQGSGQSDPFYGEKLCDVCHGTGRIPGIAASLFAAQPIERVVLTDVEPVDGIPGHWVFPDLSGLPALIQYVIDRTHPTRQAALDALSRAACTYGRSLAGLRPLSGSPGMLG